MFRSKVGVKFRLGCSLTETRFRILEFCYRIRGTDLWSRLVSVPRTVVLIRIASRDQIVYVFAPVLHRNVHSVARELLRNLMLGSCGIETYLSRLVYLCRGESTALSIYTNRFSRRYTTAV